MTTRRNFIRTSVLATAGAGMTASMSTALNSCIGANEKLVCGLIGARNMGFNNLKAFLAQKNTHCAAICDVDENILNKRIADVENIQGTKPQGFKDFRKLLEQPGIDVIIIGTPDHWHCLPFVYAAQEGKSIYVEKPLANTMEEINIMEQAVNRYNIVAQVGQWQRSDKHWQDAVRYLHSGKLGKIRAVNTWAAPQAWMGSYPVKPDEPVPHGVDYDFWLGPAQARPFNINRFHHHFRFFWDYGGGLMTDWGVHVIDYSLIGMKSGTPKSAVAIGGRFLYPESATETPDTMQVSYDYGDYILIWSQGVGINGFNHGRHHGIAFYGKEGALIIDRDGWEVIPEGKSSLEKVELQKVDGNGLDNHLANFISCVKDRDNLLNCNVSEAANTARVCVLGNMAYRTGQAIRWDSIQSKVIDNPEANQMLVPNYRSPWELPKI